LKGVLHIKQKTCIVTKHSIVIIWFVAIFTVYHICIYATMVFNPVKEERKWYLKK